MYKQDEKRAAQIVALAIQLVGLLAILIEPFMPILSKTMMSQLGLDSNQKQLLLPEVFGPMLKSGHTLGEIKPLISQISDDTVRICKEKYQGKQA